MEEWWLRFSHDVVGRLDGPLHFRFILQPMMALALAIRDGFRDARTGDTAYLWSICKDKDLRWRLLRKGWKAVNRVFFLAIALDVAYQIIAFPKFYPFETMVTAALLAIVPYILLRGPINRIARLLVRQESVPHPAHPERL
jgi:hypothetical protein